MAHLIFPKSSRSIHSVGASILAAALFAFAPAAGAQEQQAETASENEMAETAGDNAAANTGAQADSSANAPAEASGDARNKGGNNLPPAFQFGSYGRVQIGSDLQGRTGRQTNIASRGPRLIEPSYQELWFKYRMVDPKGEAGTTASVVATLALDEKAFHYTGDFDVGMALRNMYLQVDDLFVKNLSLWAGSRMYRGDDIYLLDYWPLDNLNTLGGGLSFKVEKLQVDAHVGVNRLDNDYQLQIISSPSIDGVGAVEDEALDRQRTIVSLRLTYPILGNGLARLYAEHHNLPSGQREEQDTGATYALPSDMGWVVGAQLKGWTDSNSLHGSLWVKFGEGLGAYGDMVTPFGLNTDRKTSGAKLFTAAFSGAYEHERFAVPLAAYVSVFRDATKLENNVRDYEEFVANIRPTVYILKQFHIALDLSYQLKTPHAFSFDNETPRRAQVFQVGLMPSFTPFGEGWLGRPVIRIIYALRAMNADARAMIYGQADERFDRKIAHFLGLSAEWWFNN